MKEGKAVGGGGGGGGGGLCRLYRWSVYPAVGLVAVLLEEPEGLQVCEQLWWTADISCCWVTSWSCFSVAAAQVL